jgi:hypothetical protein
MDQPRPRLTEQRWRFITEGFLSHQTDAKPYSERTTFLYIKQLITPDDVSLCKFRKPD